MMNAAAPVYSAPHKPRLNRFNGCCARCKRRHSIGVRAKSAVSLVAFGEGAAIHHNGVSATEAVLNEHDYWMPASNGVPVVFCCDKGVTVKEVKGTLSVAHKCEYSCMSSKGHVCVCSCGGQNHGAMWSGSYHRQMSFPL